MRISGSGPNTTDKVHDAGSANAAEAIGETKEKKGRGKAHSVDTEHSEKVSISEKAKDSARAKEVARSAPDTDEAKVAKLKAAIKNGTYSVDADKVADRLVEEHLASVY